jgi:hypothetical protein
MIEYLLRKIPAIKRVLDSQKLLDESAASFIAITKLHLEILEKLKSQEVLIDQLTENYLDVLECLTYPNDEIITVDELEEIPPKNKKDLN